MVVADIELEPHCRLAKTILSTKSDPLRYQPLREAFQIRKQQPWLGRDDSRISALKRSKNIRNSKIYSKSLKGKRDAYRIGVKRRLEKLFSSRQAPLLRGNIQGIFVMKLTMKLGPVDNF